MKYSLLRLMLFGVCLGVLLLVRVQAMLAVLFAAVISAALSYLFLRRQRDQVVEAIGARAEARAAAAGVRDEDVEDAEVSRRYEADAG